MTSPLRDDVVALFVDERGPYPSIVREWYDERRDARTYAGDRPVVAHPPCGPWSKLRHLYRGGERDLALFGLEVVRRVGGVLEHPAHSGLWFEADLPRPGRGADRFGGWTLPVNQVDWGHPARKATWLYVVRCRAIIDLPPAREPTHWASGSRGGRVRWPSDKVPPGIKVCSAQQRRRTPIAFARWLVDLASSSAPT